MIKLLSKEVKVKVKLKEESRTEKYPEMMYPKTIISRLLKEILEEAIKLRMAFEAKLSS